MREGEVVCCAEGMTRGECGLWAGQKRQSVCRRDVLCGLVCSTAALIGMTSPSEPINLPLGYTRGTHKAELSRRARIYANWGNTT
jgi:hypothetical protein